MKKFWRRIAASKGVPPATRPAANPVSTGRRPARGWRRFIAATQDLGEVAKLIALLLAVAGFLAIYFPDARRWLEVHSPRADSWYSIGVLRGAPAYNRFHETIYYHPAWDGSYDSAPVFDLREQVLLTIRGKSSEEPVVGRTSAGPQGAVREIYGPGTCLYVSDIAMRPFARRRVEGRPTEETRLPFRPGNALWARNRSQVDPQELGGRSYRDAAMASLPRAMTDPRLQCAERLADPGQQLCPRIAIWVKARRVSC